MHYPLKYKRATLPTLDIFYASSDHVFPNRTCYNFNLFLQAADLTKPIDKRVYKGTFPTCHDFNEMLITSDSVQLLVGFTAGQVQLIDPIKKEPSKLFNE